MTLKVFFHVPPWPECVLDLVWNGSRVPESHFYIGLF